MKTIARAALLAALFANPALSQEAQTDASEGEGASAGASADASAGANADASADTGANAEATPTAPQDAAAAKTGETIVAVHKDWQIRCLPGNKNCYMYQLAIDARDAPVAEMSVVALKQDNDVVAGFTVMSPLRTHLPAGVQVQIDNGPLQRYQFEFCAEQGCIVRFGVNESGLGKFRAGNKVRLTVVSAENRDTPVILDVSLLGFTAAMKELSGL